MNPEGSQVGGTAGLIAVMDPGSEVRQQLDSVVRNTFQNSPVVLAEWETASRIVRALRQTGRETGAGRGASGVSDLFG